MSIIEYFKRKDLNFYMLDVETDGLSPSKNSMTSICIQQFMPREGLIIGEPFHARITKLPGRIQNKQTMTFRYEYKIAEMEAHLNFQGYKTALEDIASFLRQDDNKPVLFANHTEFDVGFLQSYYDECNLARPWHYSHVHNLPDFLKIMSKNPRNLKKEVLQSSWWNEILLANFNGKEQPHNAHYDCCLQIGKLAEALTQFTEAYNLTPFKELKNANK